MSVELTEKDRELFQMIEVDKVSKGPMETSIDPHLQEEQSTIGPIEEWVEIQVDPKKPS